MTTTVQEPFIFDADSARSEYEQHGWFIARNGVHPDLMAQMTAQVADMLGTGAGELGAWRYPDKKSQFLWQPATDSVIEAICRSVALATGMNPDTTIVSERHLKVYSDTAPEMPPAHKDRSASDVTVGIGIDIPEESRLVMWPTVDETYNPYPTAAEWRETRHSDELPEKVTQGIAPIEIDMRRGDVVMFRGAQTYHERHKPACTSVLYLKFNDRGLDPLGEDPRTVMLEQESDSIRAAGLRSDTRVSISPRVVGLRTDELFPDLGQVTYARTIENERAVRLADAEASLVRRLGAQRTCDVSSTGLDVADLERLAEGRLLIFS